MFGTLLGLVPSKRAFFRIKLCKTVGCYKVRCDHSGKSVSLGSTNDAEWKSLPPTASLKPHLHGRKFLARLG